MLSATASRRRARRLALALAAGLALALTACAGELPPPPQPGPKHVKVITLTGPDTSVERSFPGRVRASERVDLSFEVAGRIIELPAAQGSQVEKGALLARLDARDFESELKAAQADFDKAEANFQRAAKLLEKDFVSKAEYEQFKATRDIAAARLATARKGVEDTELRAPFDGLVARRFVENFTDVRAKEPIVSLQDVSTVEVVVDVPERIVAMRERGSTPTIVASFDALPGRTFPLTIKEFATEADPKTGAYEYVTAMKKPEGVNILPGMTATVIASRPDYRAGEGVRFVVPVQALFADITATPSVWIVDEANRIHRRAVAIGQLTGQEGIEVLDGLAVGDVVAVSAVVRLQEGMSIAPVEAGREASEG
jgi:multidrug efflux system membrane fusion protein